MCLAIFKPADKEIPEEHLQEGWIRNPDGAGLAYIENGKVKTRKGFMTFKEFLAAYKEVRGKFPSSPMLVHFRIRSMGDKGPEHTHPHELTGGALIHNGTITGTGAIYSKGPSDTEFLARTLNGKINYEAITTHQKEWDEALDYNKVVFLFDDGRHAFINEKVGVWHDGVWYSNNAYKKYEYTGSYTRGHHGSMID